MLVCHASVILPLGMTAGSAWARRKNGTVNAIVANAAVCSTLRRAIRTAVIAAPPVQRAQFFQEPCSDCRSAMQRSLRRYLLFGLSDPPPRTCSDTASPSSYGFADWVNL